MGVEEHRLHTTEDDALIGLYQNSLSQPGPDSSSRILAGALVDEPLSIHFGAMPRLRGRWDRAVHLSISRAFLARRAMEDLGLPRVSPWYPLVTGPFRFIGHKLVRLFPRGGDMLIRRGLAQQEEELRIRTGTNVPSHFAGHVQATASASSA